MADPITLGLLAGGGLQAASSIQEGRITSAQGSFAKKIALRNQQALERQAKAEQEAASVEADRIARQEKIHKGKQRAAIGKSGTGLAGATLAVLTDTAAQFSIERNLALRRGFLRGRQLKEQGRIIAAQGRWAKTLGNQARRLSYVKAGASILSIAALASYYGNAPVSSIYGASPSGGMLTATSGMTTAQRTSAATIARF